MIYLTRRERFCAAHRMFRPEWTDEKNAEIFGKCSNANWHGHNYVLWVTVKGELLPEHGFIMNINVLKEMINERIIAKIDHRNINLEVGFMHGKIATTENLAVAIWNELELPVREKGARLHCIRIDETENNSIEYYGEQD